MVKFFSFFFIIGAIAFSLSVSQAKGGDEQDQIILLNDSASALEETDPGLSRMLTKFADEQEKDWEDKNANKNVAPIPMTDKYKALLQDRVRLLKRASRAIQPAYPLIAKGLDQMAKDLNKAMGIEK